MERVLPRPQDAWTTEVGATTTRDVACVRPACRGRFRRDRTEPVLGQADGDQRRAGRGGDAGKAPITHASGLIASLSRSAIRRRTGSGSHQSGASWEIEVSCWAPDDPEEEPGNHTSATGHALVSCALPVAPTAEEIAHLLTCVDEKPPLLAEGADAPVGAALAETAMVVTDRYDS
ncbi:hypothetical protein [Streptomyces hydrogenans]